MNPRSIHPFLAVLTFVGIGASPAACQAAAPSGSLSELADVRRWAASKFESAPAAFAICADVRKPGVDWALIRRLAEQWRQVADCFLGDFYPLTSYQLNEELWLAWQFDLPEQSRGMVQVFRRAGSNYESVRFKLRSLNPAATCAVTDLDQSSSSRKLSGRELLEHGLLISAPEQPSARMITYQQSTKDN